MKICIIDQTEFEPKRTNQVYCSKKCSDEGRRRHQHVTEPLPPAELAQTHLEAKVVRLDAAKIAAQRETAAAKKELTIAQSERDQALHALSLFDAGEGTQPEWAQVHKSKQHYGTLIGILSDTHYGEVVNPDELGGYNKYDLEIAEMRTERFFTRSIRVARNYLTGVKYDGFYLALGGDLVSGDIHDELAQTNEISTYETIYITVPWLTRGVEMLLEEFGKVHVVSAPGNHGRDSKKPRHKRRSEYNADTLIAKLVSRHFSGDERVTFDIPQSTDVDFEIYGYTFSMEHGDNLRFSGTSEIGSIGPVKRGSLRKTKKRQEQGRPVKYNIFGHFHQYVPAYTQGFIMNGSVKGYDEYASDGQFAPEPAQQAMLVVTPEHGITIPAAILVSDRDAEGW